MTPINNNNINKSEVSNGASNSLPETEQAVKEVSNQVFSSPSDPSAKPYENKKRARFADDTVDNEQPAQNANNTSMLHRVTSFVSKKMKQTLGHLYPINPEQTQGIYDTQTKIEDALCRLENVEGQSSLHTVLSKCASGGQTLTNAASFAFGRNRLFNAFSSGFSFITSTYDPKLVVKKAEDLFERATNLISELEDQLKETSKQISTYKDSLTDYTTPLNEKQFLLQETQDQLSVLEEGMRILEDSKVIDLQEKIKAIKPLFQSVTEHYQALQSFQETIDSGNSSRNALLEQLSQITKKINENNETIENLKDCGSIDYEKISELHQEIVFLNKTIEENNNVLINLQSYFNTLNEEVSKMVDAHLASALDIKENLNLSIKNINEEIAETQNKINTINKNIQEAENFQQSTNAFVEKSKERLLKVTVS